MMMMKFDRKDRSMDGQMMMMVASQWMEAWMVR